LKLPQLRFANITGGEPFLRDDIDDIISIVKKKASRVVISTNGYMSDRILSIMTKHKDVGVRVSIEGMPETNDALRGKKYCFDHSLQTLMGLKKTGLRDIGIAITVSDNNASDVSDLYKTARVYGFEFATAVVHNSYYFHIHNNRIVKQNEVVDAFACLIATLLRTNRPKNWYRAYFNVGLIQYVLGKPRLLPCGAGSDMFFLDPFGEIRPCNGMASDDQMNSMGNLRELSFAEIWNSPQAQKLRERVRTCPRNCWMIGTAAPAMKKSIVMPTIWVVRNKLRSLLHKHWVWP
jgi:radical SAM protein with 4Fe4S-binding SPASM domain